MNKLFQPTSVSISVCIYLFDVVVCRLQRECNFHDEAFELLHGLLVLNKFVAIFLRNHNNVGINCSLFFSH